MSLTNKQKAFVLHYLGDCLWNATAAAEAAGYNGSRHTLSNIGYPNLRHSKIKVHIARRMEEMGVNAQALLLRWLERSRVDISSYIVKRGADGDDVVGGFYLDVQALKDAGYGYLIKGVTVNARGHTNVVLRDPDVAEDRIARHLGMFVDRHEHSGPKGGPIETSDATPDLSGFTNEELDTLAAFARRLQADKPPESP